MRSIGFWILETVVDPGDWDCSKIELFKSYESLMDRIRREFDEYDTKPKFVDSKDENGYTRTLVYDVYDDEDPWYIIHHGSIVVD